MPDYMTDILPSTVGECTNMNLRNKNNISGIFARTEKFKNSFYPRSIAEYNELPLKIKSATSISDFKNKLKSSNCKPKIWYSHGERKISIVQARLRMECSSLKDHLCKLSIIQEATCSCGFKSESVHHYFLTCPLYMTERVELQENLRQINFKITIDNILFGDENRTVDENILANSFIQHFIKCTKRFDC